MSLWSFFNEVWKEVSGQNQREHELKLQKLKMKELEKKKQIEEAKTREISEQNQREHELKMQKLRMKELEKKKQIEEAKARLKTEMSGQNQREHELKMQKLRMKELQKKKQIEEAKAQSKKQMDETTLNQMMAKLKIEAKPRVTNATSVKTTTINNYYDDSKCQSPTDTIDPGIECALRKKWKINSKCEIYSSSKQKWFDCVISDITKEDGKECLHLTFRYESHGVYYIKTRQRSDPDIRPNDMIDPEIDCALRKKWEINSKCEVYSYLKHKWFDCVISDITKEDGKECLHLRFRYESHGGLYKTTAQRYHPNIRPNGESVEAVKKAYVKNNIRKKQELDKQQRELDTKRKKQELYEKRKKKELYEQQQSLRRKQQKLDEDRKKQTLYQKELKKKKKKLKKQHKK